MVDVFVEERGTGYVVTDYGDALGWLRMQSASGKLSPKQRWMIGDVCLTLGVELDRGQLTLPCEDGSALSDAVHRGAQAVVRVSDVWFTFRTRTGESIADEVDEWLRQPALHLRAGDSAFRAVWSVTGRWTTKSSPGRTGRWCSC